MLVAAYTYSMPLKKLTQNQVHTVVTGRAGTARKTRALMSPGVVGGGTLPRLQEL